ncbi:hypothetical protein BDN72DRAFT_863791 [Pluteus cervinus]|uniref:Uncharacterized protein n=1 Tax=Pluteus cervinus TaxID=181527 RepID=A0ACD3A6B5_9AGAR|nr:hypothetical protein BDN72DRAFT_863791 [Pluteus cervinus]
MSAQQSQLELLLQALSESPYNPLPIQQPDTDIVQHHVSETRWQGRGGLAVLCHSDLDADYDGDPFACRIRATVIQDKLKWSGTANDGHLVLGRGSGVRGRTFNQSISALQALPGTLKWKGNMKTCVKYEEMDSAMLTVTTQGGDLQTSITDTQSNPIVPQGGSYGLRGKEVDVTFILYITPKTAKRGRRMVAAATAVVVV